MLIWDMLKSGLCVASDNVQMRLKPIHAKRFRRSLWKWFAGHFRDA
jgi:hypothetical protein